MFLKSLLLSVSLLIHPLTSANAASNLNNKWVYDKDYFRVTSVEKTETALTEEDQKRVQFLGSQRLLQIQNDSAVNPTLTEASLSLDVILNMGKKIWQVIVDGKPVVNSNTSRANALPQGAKSWLQLANWSDPEAHRYDITYKNMYGAAVVKYAFLVTYSYGGSVNGKGKYLSEVGFTNSELSVAWMYNFNATSEVVRVVNVGTVDEPIAGMELNLNWTIKTPLQEQQSTSSYYVRGDGVFKAL